MRGWLNPNYAVAHTNRGSVRFMREDDAGAEADWRRAVELNPGYEPALRPWIERAREKLKQQDEF